MKFWEALRAAEKGIKVKVKGRSAEEEASWTISVDWTALLESEWELSCDVPEKTYSFMEVVEGLQHGQKFKRKGWKGNHIYYSARDFALLDQDQDGAELELPDFQATDWIEVKE